MIASLPPFSLSLSLSLSLSFSAYPTSTVGPIIMEHLPSPPTSLGRP